MVENEDRYSIKKAPFQRKRTAFLLGISLHFRPFVVSYGFNADRNDIWYESQVDMHWNDEENNVKKHLFSPECMYVLTLNFFLF